jgi:hypothetical protein
VKRTSRAGAKPFDMVLMFNILVPQQLRNLSNDSIEYKSAIGASYSAKDDYLMPFMLGSSYAQVFLHIR